MRGQNRIGGFVGRAGTGRLPLARGAASRG